METREILLLLELGRKAGVRPGAEPDFLARGAAQFPKDASAADVTTWLHNLKPTAPHLFVSPPASGADSGGVPPKQAHRSTVELTSAQVAALAKMSPTARMTAYREMQRTRNREKS